MIRHWRQSLFGQLLISQLALLLVLAVALPAIVLIDLDRTADAYVEQRLSADADVLTRAWNSQLALRQTRVVQLLGPFYMAPWGSRAFRVSDDVGTVRMSGGLVSAMPPTNSCRDKGLEHLGRLDIYCRRLIVRRQPITITIAQDRSRPEVIVDDVVAGFLARTLWLIPLILLCSTIALLLVVRRVTRQLHGASAAADRIAPSRLDIRIDSTSLPLEARGFATATNAALDRVEAGFQRQRSFVSSVAHELRTPLALLTLRCDALPDVVERAPVRAAIDQLSHVVDQLMDLATIEARRLTLEPVDLGQIARTTVEDLALIVYRANHTIELAEATEAPIIAMGNPGLLRIALSNLIDNAIRHTPAATHIAVSVKPGTLTVSDGGPGITTLDGQRFRSAGEQRSDGAGLGLAIVQRIMTAMEGHMTVKGTGPGTEVGLVLKSMHGDDRKAYDV